MYKALLDHEHFKTNRWDWLGIIVECHIKHRYCRWINVLLAAVKLTFLPKKWKTEGVGFTYSVHMRCCSISQNIPSLCWLKWYTAVNNLDVSQYNWEEIVMFLFGWQKKVFLDKVLT